MTPRNFLIRGLIAGFVAGLLTFFVSYTVGEIQVDAAIAIEEAGSEEAGHSHGEEAEAGHSHEEEDAGGIEVSRSAQKTWGLLTGTLAVSVVIGGLVSLIAAGVAGRLRGLSVGQSTALVTFLGFIGFALVPFLKYPAAPPAVGSGDTIGQRTALFFGFLAVSLVGIVAATYLANRLAGKIGAFNAVASGILTYVAITVIAAIAFPVVNELGDFPADVLWSFRISSLFTLATMWGVIGLVLTGLVLKLEQSEFDESVRKELAASL